MQTLTYIIGSNRRSLVSDVQNFKINWSDEPNYNWVQARQYEKQMRQVFVNVKNEDGSPFDLTGANIWFEGLLPDGTHRVLDAKNGTVLEPTNGQFRFDFPDQAFTVAGSYKQAFFRIVRDGMSVTTLEFDLEVLADKVITGLVPTDYITPFEDLYSDLEEILNNADGDLHAKLDEWTTEYTAKVQELTELGTNVTNSLTSVQNRLSTLETKIQEDGLFTQEEANEWKTGVLDEVRQAVLTLTKPQPMISWVNDTADFYGEPLPDYYYEAMEHVTNDVPSENFNVVALADNHWQEDGDLFTGYTAKSLEKIQWGALSTLGNNADAYVLLGDNTNGDEQTEQLKFTTRHVVNVARNANVDTDVFFLRGNHDNGAGHQQTSVSNNGGKVLSTSDLKREYGTALRYYNEVRDGDSLYFYKDYPDKKVRLIGLDSNDVPFEDISNENYKYSTAQAGFRSQQLNWLANTALKLPANDWQVLITFHIPLAQAFGGWDNTENFANSQLFIDIISHFKNGTSTTLNSSRQDFVVNGLNVNFTAQGPGTVIAILNGHLHYDTQDTTLLNGTPIIEITCSGSFVSSVVDDSARRDTEDDDAWDVVSVDTTNRVVKTFRFGRGADRTFNY